LKNSIIGGIDSGINSRTHSVQNSNFIPINGRGTALSGARLSGGADTTYLFM